MNLNKRYNKETGLHSHYIRHSTNGKKELIYTRKYVWWLELIIKDAVNCVKETSVGSPLRDIEKTYKILSGG